ncbi:MAG: MarR family transcriptional regulator [Ornithinimicrobium sp.]
MQSNESPWLTDEEQRVWRQWIAANSEMTAALGRGLAHDCGLSLPDFQVLVRLSETPQSRVRIVELADDMQWERSRLSHHLTRMEKRELIVRRDCPEDRRGAFAELTAHGRSQLEEAAPGHARLVRSLLFDDLSEQDLQVLGRVTQSLLHRLSTQ